MYNKSTTIVNQTKKITRISIPLKRAIINYYTKCLLVIKVIIVILIFVLLFTNKLNFIQIEITNKLIGIASDFGFRLEKVIIDGQQNVATSKIMAAINADTGAPIFDIDIQRVKAELEKNSWIRNAIVERRLPNTIYVGILERKPIAIWQLNKKLYLIDNEGIVMHTDKISEFSSLLHLVGPGANLHANKLILTIGSEPSLASKIVSAVRYGNRRWNLIFQENITVKMPEDDFNKAWQYLVKLFQSNKFFNQKYKVLDLRDSSKYYIEYCN
ncbi:cell division FtsQ family protein [Orientia chuto str. Dubai]|uniref:Cell division FtsQ family protein n=1 Tax=Orientia chuto str. Dubai TaxID=1359168 RepID=A0A0F3MPN5_9RICK|nr:FtsQ-type POTRA domain-containing protein [Candidatus Orientia mediorientalis]KJV56549.1 cell division FtsQ family protein [Orientia chuto str. Dubai]